VARFTSKPKIKPDSTAQKKDRADNGLRAKLPESRLSTLNDVAGWQILTTSLHGDAFSVGQETATLL